MWIDEEIHPHRHSLAPLAEKVQDLIRSNVRFCHQNRIAGLPTKVPTKFLQVIKRFMRLFLGIRTLIRDHERPASTPSGAARLGIAPSPRLFEVAACRCDRQPLLSPEFCKFLT